MSFGRYESYRDSGVDWLGEVPSHWTVERLKRLCDVRPSNVDKKSYDDEEPVRLCNYTDVYYNECITRSLDLMEASASSEQIERFGLRAGDVIVTKDSETADDIAIAAHVPETMPGVVCGYHLALLRPRDRTEGGFIKRYFDGAFAKALVAVQANGLTRVGLGQYALDNLLVPTPPPDEQRAIAAFLDRETAKIDALVEEQRRLMELLKEKRQSVISHAVTKGLAPAAPMKDSGVEWLGEVPEHWEVVRLANLFREVAEPINEDLPILSVSIHLGVSDEELDEADLVRKVSRSEDRSKYKRVRPNDLVYNMMRAWQGGFGTVAVEGGVSPAYVVARPKVAMETAFIEWVLRTPQCVEEMRTRSVGVTDFRLRLYWDEFRELRIALPPVTEQRRILDEIGSELARYDRLAEAAKAATELLSERRAALISAAVTGKIDVRSAGPTAAISRSRLRMIVGATIIEALANKPNSGRTKPHKIVYLTEAHAGVHELEGAYLRQAAGPLDADLLDEVERELEAAGHVAVEQPGGRGSQVIYRVKKRRGAFREELEAALGSRTKVLDQLIANLGDLDTKHVEAVATLYAVWNDALLDGEAPSDDAIVAAFLNDWHPEKRQKFRAHELHTWLGWMRRYGLVPRGQGPKTSTGRLFV